MADAPVSWLPLFEEFVGDLRINSKEESNPEGGGIPLVLWESQRRFLREVAIGLDQGQKYFLCCKSRQLGVTTVSLAIDIFWLAMHPGMTMAIVTDTEGNRDKNRVTIKQYIDSFEEGYFDEDFFITKDNRTQMVFSNGSRIDWKVAGTKDRGTAWAEGEGYACCHVTEIANFGSEAAIESFEESLAQKNPQSIFLFESTAKGENNIWHTKWQEGLHDPLTKRSFFIGWWASATNILPQDTPLFAKYGLEPLTREEAELVKIVKQQYDFDISKEQIAWYRWRDDTNTGGNLFANQPWTHQQAFSATGHSFFQTRQIAKDLQALDQGGEDYGFLAYRYEFGNDFFALRCHMLEEDEDLDGTELRVWEEPVSGGRYVIGCDPAYGRTDHADRSVISVWRCYADKMIQVAEYATAEDEVKYVGWVLAHIAGAFSDCIVNLEIYGGGSLIMQEWDHIRQLIGGGQAVGGGEGMAVNPAEGWTDALNNARWYLYRRVDAAGAAGYCYNFNTTHRSKQELMFGMRGSYVTRELVPRSKALFYEMTNVIQDGGTIGAPDSSNPDRKDDRVFAAAFAHRAWINWRRPEMMAQNLTYQVVTDEETGVTSKIARSMNGLITRFWQNAIEMANNPPEQGTWRTDRGLE